MRVDKLRTKDEQEIAVMYLLERGWSKTQISRALGYAASAALSTALSRGNGLPNPRAERLAQLTHIVTENPNTKKPGLEPWSIDAPLPVRLAGQPVPPPPPVKHEPQDDDGPMDRLSLLDACRKDAERIRARLQRGLADAPPIVRPGMEIAMEQAQKLAALLTV